MKSQSCGSGQNKSSAPAIPTSAKLVYTVKKILGTKIKSFPACKLLVKCHTLKWIREQFRLREDICKSCVKQLSGVQVSVGGNCVDVYSATTQIWWSLGLWLRGQHTNNLDTSGKFWRPLTDFKGAIRRNKVFGLCIHIFIRMPNRNNFII